jgi:ElaB/YqjD/DUF883 family membrane-anchored ribosome-binding protein
MKISKSNAQKAKDNARAEKQKIMREANKTMTTKQKARIADLNKVIEAADHIIEGS